MTELAVAINDEYVYDGDTVSGPQESQELAIDWDVVDGYNFYAVKVENETLKEPVLYRINIVDHEGGTDMVKESEELAPGDYLVTLYGQSKEIRGDEVKSGDLEPLEQLEFHISPLASSEYGCGCQDGGKKESGKGSYGQGYVMKRSSKEDLLTKPISRRRSPRGRSDVIVSPDLPLHQRKYCSCLVGAGKTETPECLSKNAEYAKIGGHTCYSPHAVCRTSTKLKGRTPHCLQYYIFDQMTDAELISVALQHGLEFPAKTSWNGEDLVPEEREDLLRSLRNKQESKGRAIVSVTRESPKRKSSRRSGRKSSRTKR